MSQINKSSDYFSTNLWVADDSSPRSFTGFGHQPDFVWVKHRGSASINHTLTDSVRGGDKMLASNTTAVEDTKSHGEITSFDSDGITVADGTNATYPRLYFNDLDPFGSGGGNYVGWSWKAGGTASSNTDGSITSNVSANTTSGFSVATFTGNGTGSATIGHGLGVAPKFVIIKNRGRAGESWQTWFDNNKRLNLNSTAVSFISTNPISTSSTLVTTPSTVDSGWNLNNDTYVMYSFAEKKGFSKFGSYTGNGSTNGTFVYLGFRPAWILVKSSTLTQGWGMWDNKRNPSNSAEKILVASANVAELTGFDMDILSNGFKLRQTDANSNQSGATYIYMAFAENPLVGTNNIPATAR